MSGCFPVFRSLNNFGGYSLGLGFWFLRKQWFSERIPEFVVIVFDGEKIWAWFECFGRRIRSKLKSFFFEFEGICVRRSLSWEKFKDSRKKIAVKDLEFVVTRLLSFGIEVFLCWNKLKVEWVVRDCEKKRRKKVKRIT